MTRNDVANRVRDELEAIFPGATAFEPATVDDVDRLIVAVAEAFDDVREHLASARRALAEREEDADVDRS